MLARPRGVEEPPLRRGQFPPGDGRQPSITYGTPPPPNRGLPPRNGRGDYSRLANLAPPISPAPRPGPGRKPSPGPMPGPPMRTMHPGPRPRPHPGPGRRWNRIVHNPHLSKRWRVSLGLLGVVLVLSICGIGSYMIVLDEQKGVQAQANVTTPKATITPVDISSRTVDPDPLTRDEVFPSRTILIDPERPDEVYTLIGSVQELTECEPATDGDITSLIADMGCSQVVRATMKTPAEGYVVTGGIMNLDTAANAEKAWEKISEIVEGATGRFVGYVINSDRSTKPLALASTQVGWAVKGHYIAYCVIARTDSKEIPEKDPFAEQIMVDIVQLYLKDKILEARATDPVIDEGASPEASPSP